MIEVKNLTHIYNEGTAMQSHAFENVSFTIERGEFIGLIGHTGSGKSTMIQHLNGLLKPTSGTVYFDGEDIFQKDYNLRKLRSKVGMVFQYPEYQLFEETVLKDVMYGPLNMQLSNDEALKRAKDALRLLGVSEDLWEHSPFELSGGQKRRVAIAGVLAMDPDVLILDEPAAGLDPGGRKDVLDTIYSLKKERNITVILVSHSMDDVAEYADRIMVLYKGDLKYFDTPEEVFSHVEELEEIGLSAPQITYLMYDLKKAGIDVDLNANTVDEAVETILNAFK
ncbi:MAG: energy-coupling factor transporter ATPase [Eubacteriales bacterium]|nr:energy-coupling factor transporter ATPase [Eubacteriales bacterium]